MTGAQLSLDLKTRKTRKKFGAKCAAEMMRLLVGTKAWLTRAEFARRSGMSDRACRLGREWAHGRIIRGPKGYKWLSCATVEEVEEAARLWLSSIKSEVKQYRQMMRRAHKILHGEGR